MKQKQTNNNSKMSREIIKLHGKPKEKKRKTFIFNFLFVSLFEES